MKKLQISLKRLTWTLFLGSALVAGTSACSTGTNDGSVNVEESDYKDKSPTENNSEGLSDNNQTQNARALEQDSSYEEIYDRQEEIGRQRNTGSGVGGAANTTGQ